MYPDTEDRGDRSMGMGVTSVGGWLGCSWPRESEDKEEEVNMDMGQGYIDTKQDQLSTEPKQVYSGC